MSDKKSAQKSGRRKIASGTKKNENAIVKLGKKTIMAGKNIVAKITKTIRETTFVDAPKSQVKREPAKTQGAVAGHQAYVPRAMVRTNSNPQRNIPGAIPQAVTQRVVQPINQAEIPIQRSATSVQRSAISVQRTRVRPAIPKEFMRPTSQNQDRTSSASRNSNSIRNSTTNTTKEFMRPTSQNQDRTSSAAKNRTSSASVNRNSVRNSTTNTAKESTTKEVEKEIYNTIDESKVAPSKKSTSRKSASRKSSSKKESKPSKTQSKKTEVKQNLDVPPPLPPLRPGSALIDKSAAGSRRNSGIKSIPEEKASIKVDTPPPPPPSIDRSAVESRRNSEIKNVPEENPYERTRDSIYANESHSVSQRNGEIKNAPAEKIYETILPKAIESLLPPQNDRRSSIVSTTSLPEQDKQPEKSAADSKLTEQSSSIPIPPPPPPPPPPSPPSMSIHDQIKLAKAGRENKEQGETKEKPKAMDISPDAIQSALKGLRSQGQGEAREKPKGMDISLASIQLALKGLKSVVSVEDCNPKSAPVHGISAEKQQSKDVEKGR